MTTILPQSIPVPQIATRNDSYSNQNTAQRTIEVIDIERGNVPGVLAVCAVKVGGIVIRGVRVTNRGRGTFCNFPSRKIDGVWVDLIEIVSPALRAGVVDVILAGVRELQVPR